MSQNSEFFNRIKNISDSEVEEGINTGDPYTICDLLEKTKGGPNGIYLKKLENAIKETKDIYQIYEFMFLAIDMNILYFDREGFERLIIESKIPKLMCYCMGFVPGTNIKAMLNALEQTQNAKCMQMLINNEEYSDVYEEIQQINPKYKEAVENAKKFDYYPESLKQYVEFKNNIPELKKRVIDTKIPYLITELANYIEYLNEYKGQSYDISDLVVAEEKTQDPMQAYEFLASVNVENKSGLIQIIKNSGRVKFKYYVYEYVPGLTEQEKSEIKEDIIKTDSSGKYKGLLKDVMNLNDNELGIGKE